jgi:hypothetical protein
MALSAECMHLKHRWTCETERWNISKRREGWEMHDKTRLSKCGWWKTKNYVNQTAKRTPDTGIDFRWNVQNYFTFSTVWVRERTTPTERPPLVGEMIANF